MKLPIKFILTMALATMCQTVSAYVYEPTYEIISEDPPKARFLLGQYSDIGYPENTTQEITIPEETYINGKTYSVTRIGILNPTSYIRFYSLTTLNIPASVTGIDGDVILSQEQAWSTLLQGCHALEQINVAEENETYKSIDGVLFSKDLKNMLYYPYMHGTDYVVPEGVETILCGYPTMVESIWFTSFKLPSTIKYFAGALASIVGRSYIPQTYDHIPLNFPEGMIYTTIGYEEILPSTIQCVNRATVSPEHNVTLPESLKNIGYLVVKNTEELTLPKNLDAVNSFNLDQSLKKIRIEGGLNTGYFIYQIGYNALKELTIEAAPEIIEELQKQIDDPSMNAGYTKYTLIPDPSIKLEKKITLDPLQFPLMTIRNHLNEQNPYSYNYTVRLIPVSGNPADAWNGTEGDFYIYNNGYYGEIIDDRGELSSLGRWGESCYNNPIPFHISPVSASKADQFYILDPNECTLITDTELSTYTNKRFSISLKSDADLVKHDFEEKFNKLEALINDGVNRLKVLKAESSGCHNRLTNAINHYWSAYTEASEGYLGNLLDDDPSTIWHSKWRDYEYSEDVRHSLGVRFDDGELRSTFGIYLQMRDKLSDIYGPIDVTIYGSSDGGKTFDPENTVHLGKEDLLHGKSSIWTPSDIYKLTIEMPRPCNAILYEVNKVLRMETEYDNYYFNYAEFQVFEYFTESTPVTQEQKKLQSAVDYGRQQISDYYKDYTPEYYSKFFDKAIEKLEAALSEEGREGDFDTSKYDQISPVTFYERGSGYEFKGCKPVPVSGSSDKIYVYYPPIDAYIRTYNNLNTWHDSPQQFTIVSTPFDGCTKMIGYNDKIAWLLTDEGDKRVENNLASLQVYNMLNNIIGTMLWYQLEEGSAQSLALQAARQEAESLIYIDGYDRNDFVIADYPAAVRVLQKALGIIESGIQSIMQPQSSTIYDLQGHRIEKITTPGLYIINGRVIKK